MAFELKIRGDNKTSQSKSSENFIRANRDKAYSQQVKYKASAIAEKFI